MAAMTQKQHNLLNLAILDYLSSQPNFGESAIAFAKESGLTHPPQTSERENGSLVKKWTSIVRLTKQIKELEQQVQELRKNAGINSQTLPEHSFKHSIGITNTSRRFLPNTTSSASLQGHREDVTCVRAHPLFSIIASGSKDTSVKIWDAETSKLERTLSGHTRPVHFLAFDPSGEYLATCSTDMTIKVWDMSTFKCLKTLSGHDDVVSGVVFLPMGHQLVSCSRDKSLKLWDRSTGYCVSTLTEEQQAWIRCVTVSDDGEWLASTGDDNAVHLWNRTSATTWCHTASLKHHQHHLHTVAFSHPSSLVIDNKQPLSTNIDRIGKGGDGDGGGGVYEPLLLASGGRDALICVWDVLHKTLMFSLNYHTSWVNDLSFHPDGKHLISCSDDMSIKVGDISKRRCLRSIQDAHGDGFVTSIAFSMPTSKMVSGGVDKVIKIWNCH